MPTARAFGAVTPQALLTADEAMELQAALCRRELERLVRAVAVSSGELAQESERGSAALAAGPALPFLAG